MIHPIYQLVEYALNTGIIEPEDRLYAVNSLMEVMQLDEIPTVDEAEIDEPVPPVHEILDALIDIAAEKGLVDAESIVARDLFDTKLLGRLTPPPSVIIDTFDYLYGESPEVATNWYYDFSQATNYIRRDRIARDYELIRLRRCLPWRK